MMINVKNNLPLVELIEPGRRITIQHSFYHSCSFHHVRHIRRINRIHRVHHIHHYPAS